MDAAAIAFTCRDPDRDSIDLTSIFLFLSTSSLLVIHLPYMFLFVVAVLGAWLSTCLYDGTNLPFCPDSLANITVDGALSRAMAAAPLASILKRSNSTALFLRKASMPYLHSHSPAQQQQQSQRLYTTKSENAKSSAKQSFTYRLAAASIAKRTPPRPPRLGQDFWTYTSTDPSARPPYLRSTKSDAGEDAFFAATIGGSKHDVAFGVADGVGGWQDQGVDPSEFSHGLTGLMGGTAYAHEDLHNSKANLPRPQDLLQTAYDAVIANPRIVAGGCTASLAVVDGQGRMESANLGDSGFLIFSPGKVSYRSEIQTHAFNTPFQLSKVPARIQQQHAIFGGPVHLSETPSQADVAKHQLRHGDIVVFATDGVWDNLSAQDALAIITRVMEGEGYWARKGKNDETVLDDGLVRRIPLSVREEEGGGKMAQEEKAKEYLPALIATAVMKEAKNAGLDRRRDGPFAKEVKMLYPEEAWEGGKPDDIAVVVCVAVEDATATDEKPVKAKL